MPRSSPTSIPSARAFAAASLRPCSPPPRRPLRRNGFNGNADDYYNPATAMFPSVLETRKGLPLTSASSTGRRRTTGRQRLGRRAARPFPCRPGVRRRSPPRDPFCGGRLVTRPKPRNASAASSRRGRVERATASAHTQPDWLTRMLQNLLNLFGSKGSYADVAAVLEMEMLLWPEHETPSARPGPRPRSLGLAQPASVWLDTTCVITPTTLSRTTSSSFSTSSAPEIPRPFHLVAAPRAKMSPGDATSHRNIEHRYRCRGARMGEPRAARDRMLRRGRTRDGLGERIVRVEPWVRQLVYTQLPDPPPRSSTSTSAASVACGLVTLTVTAFPPARGRGAQRRIVWSWLPAPRRGRPARSPCARWSRRRAGGRGRTRDTSG